MEKAKIEMREQQEEREEQLACERGRMAARQWWHRPASSATLAWVHSRGERGMTSRETRSWKNQVRDDSVVALPGDSTVDMVEDMDTEGDPTLDNITIQVGEYNHLLEEGADMGNNTEGDMDRA